MTLEEAIAHHRWAAENCDGEVRDEHLRMAEWLAELAMMREENAKLRELVRDMWHEGMCECGSLGKCATCMYEYPTRMCELGIEVADA